MPDKKVLVFAGSNSSTSINKRLVTYASSFIRDLDIEIIDLNDFELPVFGVDLEKEIGQPENAKILSEKFESFDGFLVSLAEHNNSYTVAFKNMFDWMSRIEGKVWRNKPLLLLSTSTGGRGGKSVMEAALSMFPRRGAIITGYFSLPSFNSNFDDEDGILDDHMKENLIEEVNNFEKTTKEHK